MAEPALTFIHLPHFYREAGSHVRTASSTMPHWSEVDMLAAIDRRSELNAHIFPSPHPACTSATARRARLRTGSMRKARLKAAHPGPIEFFASTPLPKVAGAVEEVAHAFDHLCAAGVVFETNFHGSS
jgi:hypothetical protein